MSRLRVDAITKRYGAVCAVPPASFSLNANEALGLFGPAGCGKTTLLRMLAGIETPDAGRVEGEADRTIGMVFQDLALWPHMTVRKHLEFVLKAKHQSRDALSVAVNRWFGECALEALEQRKPHELSRGQRQRLAAARALCTEPALLLLDEPMSSQDRAGRDLLCTAFRNAIENGASAVVASHDKDVISSLCERVLVFTPDGVTELPVSELVASN